MIVLYHGARGCGKTTTLVRDAYLFKIRGWKIVTNMNSLKIADVYMSEEDIIGLVQTDMNNFVIVIDEIQTLINSRRSMADKNVTFQYFIQQIRKRNVIILATTQYIRRVDNVFREHCDIDASPRIHEEYNIVEVTYTDLTRLEEGLEDYEVKVYYDASPVFDMFDTTEVIQPTVK